MTHSNHNIVLQKLKPLLALTVSPFVQGYSIRQEPIYFSTQYGDGQIVIRKLGTDEIIDSMECPKFVTMIAFRALIAKWLITRGYEI